MRAEHEEAFEAFVAARSDDLLRVGFLLTADRGHAEDLLQTALLKAYRHWGRISGEDAYPYVRRVLVTSAASWRRRRTTQEIVALPAHDTPEPPTTWPHAPGCGTAGSAASRRRWSASGSPSRWSSGRCRCCAACCPRPGRRRTPPRRLEA
ncbi:sigma factor [Modestobacter lacusdianchii]